MKCLHCNREYNDEYDFCPFCAEPKPKPKPKPKEVTPESIIRDHDAGSVSNSIIMFMAGLILGYPTVGVINFLYVMFNDELSADDIFEWWQTALWAVLFAIAAAFIYYGVCMLRSPQEKIISMQFEKDQTSICPRCGSHNIALGSKGYDWNKAWWGEVIGNDAAKYDAGAESRRVTAHCKHCGNDWLTDREWIN